MLWNERFALGIEKIDVQHKQLFNLIETAKELLIDAEDGVDCYDAIVDVLKELSDYTVYHFGFEESLLAEKDYEKLEEHIIEHQNFVKKVSEFLATDIDQDHLGVVTEVVDFLLEWVSNHVLYTDANYVSLLK